MESKAALLMRIGFDAAELRRLTMLDRAWLDADQEHRLMAIRLDLEGVARMGGSIEAFQDGPEKVA